MKKIEVSEQFLKEVHASACIERKQRIEKQFPSLFFGGVKKGKWYTSGAGNLVFYSTDEQENYGLSSIGRVWSNNLWVDKSYTWQLATHIEIESMLWKEAEKRGIWKDTKLEECLINGKGVFVNEGVFNVFYRSDDDTLWNLNGCIYKQGKFTTPLDHDKEIKETISRLEKELKELKEKVK